jgi:hypothetical protein
MYTHDHPPRCFVIPTVPPFFPFLLGTIRATLRRRGRNQSDPARLARPGSTQLN